MVERGQNRQGRMHKPAAGPDAAPAAAGAVTPLPIGKLVVLSLIMLSGSVSVSVVFPFVGFMVRDFHVARTDEDLGYYAGYIAAAFSVGNVCSNYMWGAASDLYGRRPILLLGLACSTVTSLAFGFSWSFPVAVTLRFLQGLGNGNISVAKSYISEVTDRTNQAKAFSLISLQWGSGLVLGSSIGGFFAQPSTKYPEIFPADGLFGQFPYLLPMLIISISCMIAMTLGYWLLTETLPPHMRRSGVKFAPLASVADEDELEQEPHDGARAAGASLSSPPPPPSSSSSSLSSSSLHGKSDGDDADAADDGDDADGIELLHRRGRRHSEDVEAGESGAPGDDALTPAPEDLEPFKISLMRQRPALAALVGVYFLCAFQFVIFDEAFALLALMPPSKGGLNFETSQIGLAMLVGGATTIVNQLFVFAPIVRRYGNRAAFRAGSLFTLVYFFIFPWAHKLRALPDASFWTFMSMLMIGRSMASVFQFTNIFIMVSNAVPIKHRGKFNGIAQSMASLARAIGPAVGGSILAWGLNHGGGWPLNHSVVYVLVSISALIVLLLVCSLPACLEAQYDDPDGSGRLYARRALGQSARSREMARVVPHTAQAANDNGWDDHQMLSDDAGSGVTRDLDASNVSLSMAQGDEDDYDSLELVQPLSPPSYPASSRATHSAFAE